jgi:pilus assembly protein Flp/PilA
MRRLQQFVVDFLRDESSLTAVEYAVLLSLILVVCIASLTALGTNANQTFSKVGDASATTGS